jgi:DNA-binding MarR family transcriptional regulator
MSTSVQVANSALVRSVEDLRRADAQFTRRLLAMRAPNDTDRAAMRFIADAPVDSPATPGGLAAHLGVSTAAITSLIKRLQDRGQVVVAPHPVDARSKILRPTLRDIHSPVDELSRRIESVAEEFTDEQAAHVSRFLQRLTEEIDSLPE